jgi:hypothetical protein
MAKSKVKEYRDYTETELTWIALETKLQVLEKGIRTDVFSNDRNVRHAIQCREMAEKLKKLHGVEV